MRKGNERRATGRRGGLAGRQRGRVRVWREDIERDRITGFKSRTGRDGERQKEKA